MENAPTVAPEETAESAVNVSSTLPADLYKLLEADATAEDRTVSAQIRRIIAGYYRNPKPARA